MHGPPLLRSIGDEDRKSQILDVGDRCKVLLIAQRASDRRYIALVGLLVVVTGLCPEQRARSISTPNASAQTRGKKKRPTTRNPLKIE